MNPSHSPSAHPPPSPCSRYLWARSFRSFPMGPRHSQHRSSMQHRFHSRRPRATALDRGNSSSPESGSPRRLGCPATPRRPAPPRYPPRPAFAPCPAAHALQGRGSRCSGCGACWWRDRCSIGGVSTGTSKRRGVPDSWTSPGVAAPPATLTSMSRPKRRSTARPSRTENEQGRNMLPNLICAEWTRPRIRAVPTPSAMPAKRVSSSRMILVESATAIPRQRRMDSPASLGTFRGD